MNEGESASDIQFKLLTHTNDTGCLMSAQTHPSPVNRITDRCKNITFPQLLLRMVKMHRVVSIADTIHLF